MSPLLQKQSHLDDDYFEELETSASKRHLSVASGSKKRAQNVRSDKSDLVNMESRKDRVCTMSSTSYSINFD